MTKRAKMALDVLRSGGYFRKALETGFRGEKFHTRLRTAGGAVVPGIGFATFHELEAAGMLKHRACASSTTWPEEWVLRPTEENETAWVKARLEEARAAGIEELECC